MNSTSLNCSAIAELSSVCTPLAHVQSAAKARGIEVMITGAFARDLHLHYAHGIDITRETEDVDLALAVPSWPAFAALREALLASGGFKPTRVDHCIVHESGLTLDLLPFGGIETPTREIAWPPTGETVMNVFGFQEAFTHRVMVELPEALRISVVSLPALAVLKLICWQDRHLKRPRADAHDLYLILRHYLEAGNERRLWDVFIEWTSEPDFDYTRAGARMLGRDVRGMLDEAGAKRIAHALETEIQQEGLLKLATEMQRDDTDAPRRLLAAWHRGLTEEV